MKKILIFTAIIGAFFALQSLFMKEKNQDEAKAENLTKTSENTKAQPTNQNLAESQKPKEDLKKDIEKQPSKISNKDLTDEKLPDQKVINDSKPIAVIDKKPILEKKINNKSAKLKNKKPINPENSTVEKSSDKQSPVKQSSENLNPISPNQTNDNQANDNQANLSSNSDSETQNPITLQTLKQDFLQSSFFNKEKSLYKTKGSYLGVDLLGTRNSFYAIAKFEPSDADSKGLTGIFKPTARGHNLGLGVNYKYAFNYKNFFIAPGAFFEQNSFTRAVRYYSADDNTTSKVNARTGVGIDLGYDYKRISPYITAGYSKIFYTNTSNLGYYCDNPDASGFCHASSKKDGSSRNVYSGFGSKFRVNKDFSLNLEYNYQAFQQKTAKYSYADSSGVSSNIRFKSRLDVIKLGASYNF